MDIRELKVSVFLTVLILCLTVPTMSMAAGKMIKDTGVRVVGVFQSGFRVFASKRYIKNVNGARGLKMRVMNSPVLADSIRTAFSHSTDLRFVYGYFIVEIMTNG